MDNTTVVCLGEPNEPFEIIVKTMTGRIYKIMVRPSDTIHSIKQEIFKIDNIMLDQQRLIFNGKQLDEDITVAQATLSINSTIHLLLCLRGGMFHETSGRKDFVSLNFTAKLHKGFEMIQYMRQKYNVNEVMDIAQKKLIECSTDDEINVVFALIEKYYIE